VLRRALLAAAASTRIRELTTTMPVTRDVVARFVAGDTADQVLEVTQRLLGDGLLASIDYR
jgi:proline dehydrogenase